MLHAYHALSRQLVGSTLGVFNHDLTDAAPCPWVLHVWYRARVQLRGQGNQSRADVGASVGHKILHRDGVMPRMRMSRWPARHARPPECARLGDVIGSTTGAPCARVGERAHNLSRAHTPIVSSSSSPSSSPKSSR
eukprot:3604918-Prymnesium_polylepis.1